MTYDASSPYEVCTHITIGDLENLVASFIRLGWKLTGGVSYVEVDPKTHGNVGGYFMQALYWNGYGDVVRPAAVNTP